MTVSKYYSIRGGYGMNMDGVNVINDIGGDLKINFKCRGENFTKQIDEYNLQIIKYVQEQSNSKLR